MFLLRSVRHGVGVVNLVVPLLASALAVGCVGNIQRSARVPHPGVPLNAGQPLSTPVALSAGLSNVTDVIAPEVGNPSQAVEVPGTQMRNELRLRLGQRGQLGLIYEHGFGATSQVPDSTQAPVGAGDVQGGGVSMGYAFKTDTPGLVIGTTVELMVWSVPYVEYKTCTNCLTENYTIVDRGRASPATLGFGFAPSYKRGTLTVFGGAFARNHPTTERKEFGTDITFSDGDVENGPLNVLLHAGLEVEIAPRISALVLIHQNVISDPVQYGPGVGIALTGRLGD